MRYTADEDDINWAKKGFVGKVHNIDEVSPLQQKIMDVGILSLEIILLGGNGMFIKVQEEEDFESLVRDSKEFFQHWFTSLDKWYPRAVMNGMET